MSSIARLFFLVPVLAVAIGCGGREELPQAQTPATPSPSATSAPAPDSSSPPAPAENATGVIDESQVKISPGGLPDSLKKYEVESAIVDYWNSWLNRRQTLYIDDYGAREAYYTSPEMGGNSPAPPYDVSIQAEGIRYDYSSTSRIGSRRKKDVDSGPLLGVVQDVWALPEQFQTDFGLKKLGNKKILGKDAIGYSFDFNGKTTVWLWQGIPLHVEIRRPMEKGGEGVIRFEATRIATDVEVPADKFQVPANIALKDL